MVNSNSINNNKYKLHWSVGLETISTAISSTIRVKALTVIEKQMRHQQHENREQQSKTHSNKYKLRTQLYGIVNESDNKIAIENSGQRNTI
jgi:hypothetical protein